MTAFVFFLRTSSSTGGDFTANVDTGATRAAVSMVTLEAGIRGTVYSAGDTIQIFCSVGSGSAADTSATNFASGNWANPPDSIEIITNDGVVATYDTGKYRLEGAAAYGAFVRATVASDFKVDGLQFTISSGNQSRAILFGSSGFTYNAQNNIMRETGGTNTEGIRYSTTGTLYEIINNVVFDFSNVGLQKSAFFSTGSIACYNNTVDNCGTGINIASGAGANVRVFNNLCQNNATADYSLASIDASDNNISEDTSSPNTAHQSITVTFAGVGDFQTSDTDVVGLGTDLSADSLFAFSTDRLGVSRGANWDIGAFQDVAVGGGVVWSLAYKGGLAGPSGLAGPGGGLAG